MKIRLTYILLLAGLIFGSCTDVVSFEEPAFEDGQLVFSACNSRMITKSGLEYENFEVGTKYLLYGVETANEYDWTKAILNNTQCYETDLHYIHYGPDIHFREKSYDFFGATICSTGEDYPAVNSLASESPVISLAVSHNSLDDLMYSNTLKGCTRTSGLLQMNFIHALSKIQVEVARQDDSDELKYAKIKQISIMNTHKSGDLDIVKGKWDLDQTPSDRIFLDSPLALTSSATMVKDASGDDAYMLIFPNEDNRQLEVKISYSLNEAGNEVKTASCKIYTPGSTSPFLFKQNYRYTLSITVSHDGVQVVTVLPQVYDWIDIAVPSYLGQPVTFGNLMWMDRNLGAISADYENDWYNTIGHYFQFGRNIPYILDTDMFREYTGDKYGKVNFAANVFYVMKYYGLHSETGEYRENKWHYDGTNADYYTRKINSIVNDGYRYKTGTDWSKLSADEKTALIMNAVQCIYTFDHLGNKVYGVQYVAPNNTTGTGNEVVNAAKELIRNPDYFLVEHTGLTDDQKSELYKFGFGSKVPDTYLDKPTIWTFNNNCGAKYWESGFPAKDPCPKGWRLPSRKDLEALMPTVPVNWDNENYTTTINYPKNKTTDTEDIWYGRTKDGNHVCYILKNKGTANAYRLRILSHYTNDGKRNKRYFSISRYGATSTDTDLKNYLDRTYDATTSASSKENTLWANPIETIKYPACGFIVPDTDKTPETVHPDLRSFGFGTVIRTSDSNPTGIEDSSNEGFNYVQYLSTTDYQLSIQENSRRSLGDQIRCVRDINAKD